MEIMGEDGERMTSTFRLLLNFWSKVKLALKKRKKLRGG